MIKLQKYFKSGLLSVVVIALVFSFGVFSLVKANQSQKAQTVIENAGGVVNIVNEEGEVIGKLISDDASVFGGMTTTTPNRISNFYDVGVTGCVRMADPENEVDNLLNNGIWDCLEVIDATDATSTVSAFQNNKGETMLIYDAAWIPTGIGTSTERVVVGTSTSQFVNPSSAALINALNADGSAVGDGIGLQSILKTGDMTDGANTPTTTDVVKGGIKWQADYRGLDSRDASGSFYLVPVEPGEWIVTMATSSATQTITNTTLNYFDGKTLIRFLLYDL